MNYLKVTEKNNWGHVSYHLKDGRKIQFGQGDEVPVKWPDGHESKVTVILETRSGSVGDHGHDSPFSYEEPMVVMVINGAAMKTSFTQLQLRIGEDYFFGQFTKEQNRALAEFSEALKACYD